MKKISFGCCMLGVLLACGSAKGQSTSDSDFFWIVPEVKVIPSSMVDTTFHVAVMIDHATEIAAIGVPLTYAGHPELRIDTSTFTPPDTYGVTYGPAGSDTNWTIRTSWIDHDAQAILLGFIRFARPGVMPTRDTLCYIHFDLDSSGVEARVAIDTTQFHVTERLYITTPMAEDIVAQWTPGIIDIFDATLGDMNGDGVISVHDIMILVNLLLKNHTSTPSITPADLNCDGSVSYEDIIYMVNHVFKGGPAPVAGCG